MLSDYRKKIIIIMWRGGDGAKEGTIAEILILDAIRTKLSEYA